VISFINKIFRKKSSRVILTSIDDLNQDVSPTSIDRTDVTQEDETSPSRPVNPRLEPPQLIVGIGQSVGIQRDHNEDSVFTLTTNLTSGDNNLRFGLYIVADGMGGHENGEIASSVAVSELSSHVINSLYLPIFSIPENKQELSVQEVMHTGVIHAHQKIKKQALGSGTTLTAALILGDQMTIAHVGDSRAYMIDPVGNIQLLTHDHSLVKRLEDIGQISSEQASVHPQRNVLYRALGQGEPFEPDISTFHLNQGNQLLVCTDGLWGVIPENEISNVIQTSTDPQTACQILVNLANAAGGPDNISAIIVRIPE
jgi:protein phosphatase